MKKFFDWLGNVITSGLTWVVDSIARMIGEGFRIAFAMSVFLGAGFFAMVWALFKYIPPALDGTQAARVWQAFIGPNIAPLKFIIMDVLAFDYGLTLIVSMVGLWFGAWMVATAISIVKAVMPV